MSNSSKGDSEALSDMESLLKIKQGQKTTMEHSLSSESLSIEQRECVEVDIKGLDRDIKKLERQIKSSASRSGSGIGSTIGRRPSMGDSFVESDQLSPNDKDKPATRDDFGGKDVFVGSTSTFNSTAGGDKPVHLESNNRADTSDQREDAHSDKDKTKSSARARAAFDHTFHAGGKQYFNQNFSSNTGETLNFGSGSKATRTRNRGGGDRSSARRRGPRVDSDRNRSGTGQSGKDTSEFSYRNDSGGTLRYRKDEEGNDHFYADGGNFSF